MATDAPDDQAPKHLDKVLDLPTATVRKRYVREFFDSEIADSDELERMLHILYSQPEASMYAFHRKGMPLNPLMVNAQVVGRLHIVETQGAWYVHPNFKFDFVRVTSPSWDWERELVAKGEMLFRHELAITEEERRSRERDEMLRAIADATQPDTKTWRQRVEQHGRRNAGIYTLIGIVLAVIGLAVAFG